MPTESFFSKSSLAYIASAGAGKDGKAYSIKPADGTGDFTFSRGSNLAATRVGADGLIEKGRENLFTYSNDFSNAAWTKSSATITADALTSPQGATNASYLTDDTANNFHGLYAIKNISSVVTCSIFVKYDNKQFVSFLTNNNGSSDRYAYFDLVNKTTHNISSGITASIEDVGSGWLRLSVISVSSASAYYWWNIAASNSTTAYVGDGTGRIGIFGGQLEVGLVATEYIETTTTTGTAGILEDTPRFDYSNGASCPSLLLEGSRTNLIEYSEYFDAWIKGRSSVVSNAALSPEGLGNASYLYDTTDVGTHRIYTSNVQLLTNGQSQSITLYAKSGTFFNLRMSIKQNNEADLGFGTFDFDLTEGTCSNSNGSIESIGNDGWYKCTAVGSVNASVSAKMWVYLLNDSGSQSYAGTGNDYLQIFGAQWESNASYPTSYIPNNSGGTITRAADLATGAGTSSTFNDSEGVLFIELETTKNASPSQITINDGTYTNRLIFEVRPNAAFIKALINSGGSNVYEASVSATPNTSYKVAIKYSANDIAFFVNGVKEASTTTTTAMPTGLIDLSYTGKENDGALRFVGNIKQTLVFNTALSDADLATLTTI